MTTSNWRFVSASVAGTSHLDSGTPCQDRSGQKVVATPDGPVLISVVCDGAGSAAYSDTGADEAVAAFIEAIEDYLKAGGKVADLNRDDAGLWVLLAGERLEGIALSRDHQVRDYACTLLGVVVAPDAAAFLQVGDGAIVFSQGGPGKWHCAFWPQHGEYANVTNFIVSPDALVKMEFKVLHGQIDELVMFSDGLENLVLRHVDRTPHHPFFNAMMPPVRKLRNAGRGDELSAGLSQYLSSPLVCDRTDDDKTLVLATRIAAEQSTGGAVLEVVRE